MEEKNEKVAQRIVITWNGTDYTAEFNRSTANIAEDRFGISIIDLQGGKMTKLPEFLYCAFLMHHREMKFETAESILKACPDKRGLLLKLIEMFYSTINSLFEEPESGNAASWTAF